MFNEADLAETNQRSRMWHVMLSFLIHAVVVILGILVILQYLKNKYD